jgi:hypothetical protein
MDHVTFMPKATANAATIVSFHIILVLPQPQLPSLIPRLPPIRAERRRTQTMLEMLARRILNVRKRLQHLRRSKPLQILQWPFLHTGKWRQKR